MLLVDAHQDLAWNIITFGRDYTQSAADTCLRERGTQIPIHNGDTLLGWPDYQQGQVAIIFATLFATPIRSQLGDWDTQSYADADQAYSHYNTQLDAYYRLTDEHSGKFRLISYLEDLKAVISHWEQETAETHPVGLVPLMEGAEAVRHPSELEEWWQRGVRIIGPAWIGTCYCGGTHEPGPLTHEGYALLDGMAGLGFSLDISHMDEKAVFQALDEYPGRIIASHANARALLKGNESNRFLSNRVIQGIIERDGIIGIVPFNPFLISGWKPSDGRQKAGLHHVVDQIDHICQVAGDALHTGIGSDFDGGFGLQKTPNEVDTIADLKKLVPLLAEKGYTETDTAAILGRNWIRLLTETLPEG